MAESAAELEQRAERAVRRGELLAALQLFEELIVREPRDQRVRQRMESVRALLQPAELSDRRPPEPERWEEIGDNNLDVARIGVQVDEDVAGLLIEPAAHPRREIRRLHWRHRKILGAGDARHFDRQLRMSGGGQRCSRKRQAEYQFLHRKAPFPVVRQQSRGK